MLPQLLITPPKLTKSFHFGTLTERRNKAKRDKTKIGVVNSVKMKVGEIDEKIREGKIRRMSK